MGAGSLTLLPLCRFVIHILTKQNGAGGIPRRSAFRMNFMWGLYVLLHIEGYANVIIIYYHDFVLRSSVLTNR